MKKFIIYFQLLAIIIFSGCNCKIVNNETSSGSLGIIIMDNVSSTSKAIIPDIDMIVTSYDIQLSSSDEESVMESTDINGEITIIDLKPGDWDVTVTAKNFDGQAIGGKTESIQILSNTVTNCEIVVNPYSGSGALSVTVAWDGLFNSKTIIGTLTSTTDIIPPVEFTLDEGNYIYLNNSLPAGYYRLDIDVFNAGGGEYGGANDVVRIITNQESEAVIYVTDTNPEGDSGIVTIPDMNASLDIILTGCSTSVFQGDVFTVTAETEDITSGIYLWYVDRILVLSGVDETICTIPNDLELGNHRLDAVVLTSDGSRAGRVSYNFEVTSPTATTQIIADHTVVDLYDDIPDEYISIVKTWLVDIAGQSHSGGYRIGMNLLAALNPKYAVQTFGVGFPVVTSSMLRLGRHDSVGEETFFTNADAIQNIKNILTQQHNNSNPINVLGFGWCYDMTGSYDPTEEKDPVYNIGWAGNTIDGPEGDLPWGLDSGDQAITGNSISMDTYLTTVDEYNSYCEQNGYICKVIFTTGPVDGFAVAGREGGVQREIKHDYIRNYVNTQGGILFDYADILCYNNENIKNTADWNDDGTIRTHAQIHPENLMVYDDNWNIIEPALEPDDGDHIGEVGALRLAKAMWWMLARMAGWDGQISL